MKKENIALIGFRATGKSTIGQLLAKRLGWSFVDMDVALVSSFGMEIDAWVAKHGWESFRKAESRLLNELAGRPGQVVATGGGIILDDDNRKILGGHFLVVWLRASPETILKRLREDRKTAFQRPPLTSLALDEEVRQVLEDRHPWYEATADLTLNTDGLAATELVSRILSLQDCQSE
jgi:shikimate kinase